MQIKPQPSIQLETKIDGNAAFMFKIRCLNFLAPKVEMDEALQQQNSVLFFCFFYLFISYCL